MKKIFICISAIFLVLALTACGATDSQKAIYDDDSKISATADSYYAMSYKVNTGILTSDRTISAKSFTGVRTIARFKNPDDKIKDIKLSITSGKFKLVIVKNDTKEVFVVADADKTQVVDLSEYESGDFALKIVGLEGAFNLEYNGKHNA